MCGHEAKNSSIFLCRHFDAARRSFINNSDVFLLLVNATAVKSVNEIIFTKCLDDAFELLNAWSNGFLTLQNHMIWSFWSSSAEDCWYVDKFLVFLSAFDLKKII